MDNFEHCRQLIARAERDRYLASLFAPAEQRNPLFALYAFNIEISRVRDAAREPMPGEIRLQWWREVLEGQRAGEAAAHPVAAALVETLARHQMASAPLIGLIDAHAFDLYDEAMVDFAALENYAEKIAGTIFAGAATILAGGAGPSGEVARLAG